MQFVLIVGPQAVGKMAVGMELSRQTGLKLFHNHMSIELVIRLFPYDTKEATYLIGKIRQEVFETMARSSQPGLIFTYLWAFDDPREYDDVDRLIALFESHGATTYIIELEADLETRLKRNKTPLRLQEKPSKRDIAWSEQEIIHSMKYHRFNSFPGEVKHPNYLRINNTILPSRKPLHGFGIS